MGELVGNSPATSSAGAKILRHAEMRGPQREPGFEQVLDFPGFLHSTSLYSFICFPQVTCRLIKMKFKQSI